jgi:hypothetical protein
MPVYIFRKILSLILLIEEETPNAENDESGDRNDHRYLRIDHGNEYGTDGGKDRKKSNKLIFII